MNIKALQELLRSPSNLYRLVLQKKWGGVLSDKTAISLLYKQRFGVYPNLDKPATFNEKILWLTLYDRNPKYTIMVDKYRAKEYVQGIVGEKYIVKSIGCWSNTKEIEFNELPLRYVLKCNHDSGSVVVCDNRRPKEEELLRLDKALKSNYFWFSREWAYKNVSPLVFAEEYLEARDCEIGIVDYKFYCFNGEPKYILVISNRSSGGKETFFDLSWNALDVSKGYMRHDIVPAKPSRFEEMIEIAKKLSKSIPFIRVDLFEDIDGNVRVGELTLTPSSGMIPFKPSNYDLIFGNQLALPKKATNHEELVAI